MFEAMAFQCTGQSITFGQGNPLSTCCSCRSPGLPTQLDWWNSLKQWVPTRMSVFFFHFWWFQTPAAIIIIVFNRHRKQAFFRIYKIKPDIVKVQINVKAKFRNVCTRPTSGSLVHRGSNIMLLWDSQVSLSTECPFAWSMITAVLNFFKKEKTVKNKTNKKVDLLKARVIALWANFTAILWLPVARFHAHSCWLLWSFYRMTKIPNLSWVVNRFSFAIFVKTPFPASFIKICVWEILQRSIVPMI